MKACGLVVEYNPFHNGHVYHIEEAKKTSQADCMIAVMSGSFLQRGEPAIIDKYHRTRAALKKGIDIVIELPFAYAVQNSDIFAKGAVLSLNEIGVSSICFGSEAGDISPFLDIYKRWSEKHHEFNQQLKRKLAEGISFPEAAKEAYALTNLTNEEVDLSKPNNILGFSYIKAIYDHHLSIEPLTIKRISNEFHDQSISGSIASATSIRKELHHSHKLSERIKAAVPLETLSELEQYKTIANKWHEWEHYFPFLLYRVMTMSHEELRMIHGVNEGIEFRIKATAKNATNFHDWVQQIKTKRYTWTRIQRIFVHILTNTKKEELIPVHNSTKMPYVRILGFSEKGRAYLNKKKKHLEVPIITNLSRNQDRMLQLDERASRTYYSILSPVDRKKLFKQELQAPIFM